MLPSWNQTPARTAIVEFVTRTTTAGHRDFVPPEERIAVFDNDGTLWCEKPMPIELGFALQRLASMAEREPGLRTQQPWKAAYTRDHAWLGQVVTEHYQGDDSDLKVLVRGMLEAFAGMSVETYAASAAEFLRSAGHPTLRRRLRECSYLPMVELLRFLEEHGYVNYIASGGDRDFMRLVAGEIYGIPAERVIGASSALRFIADANGGSLAYLAKPDVFDEGSVKPVRIWSRIGRRPIIAVGNSNGDAEMLQFAGGRRPALRVLVMHDDNAREFAYTGGAEQVLELARTGHWPIVSMKNDWARIFAELPLAMAAGASH